MALVSPVLGFDFFPAPEGQEGKHVVRWRHGDDEVGQCLGLQVGHRAFLRDLPGDAEQDRAGETLQVFSRQGEAEVRFVAGQRQVTRHGVDHRIVAQSRLEPDVAG